MDGEIELVSDGQSLVLNGDPSDIERFLESQALPAASPAPRGSAGYWGPLEPPPRPVARCLPTRDAGSKSLKSRQPRSKPLVDSHQPRSRASTTP